MTSSLALLQRLQKNGLLSKEAAARVLEQRDSLIKAALAKEAASLFQKAFQRTGGLRKKLDKKPMSLLDKLKTPDKTPFPAKKPPEETSGWSDVTVNLGKILALAGMTAGASAGINAMQEAIDEKKLQKNLEQSFQQVKGMVRAGDPGSPLAESAADLKPEKVRTMFDTLARYAPTLASDPVVATQYVRERASNPLAVESIQRLADMEKSVRQARERESSFSLNPISMATNLIG